MESNQLEHSQVVLNTHDAGKCLGEYCTIHNRSNHVMRSFPQHWRDDRAIMERICPHGIGHPDPDEVYMDGPWDWAHACDGCCLEENTSVENTIIDDTIIDGSKYKRSPIGTVHTHEPECLPIMTKLYSIGEECTLCTVIRTAYARGRQDAAKDAERVLGAKHNELIDAILKCGYNCDCQVGGADAMSIDTDWLWKYANSLFAAVLAARGDEQE